MMSRLVVNVLVLLFADDVFSAPLITKPHIPPSTALDFMQMFGYLESYGSDSESLYSDVALHNAIKQVQKFGGITITGVLDNDTLNLMQTPRCGVKDISNARTKRYVLGSNGWNKQKITYFIANWSPLLSFATVDTEMARAFDVWAKYSQLTFQQVTDPSADVIIGFSSGPHGDGYPFDGPGRILAHAFFPGEFGSYEGDIHFDNDEDWKLNPGEFEDGIDFFTVAVHELGHSLGLGHSATPDSIMNPYYKRHQTSTFSLGYDDILGLYHLYITKKLEDRSTTNSEEESTSTTTETPSTTDTQTTIITTTNRIGTTTTTTASSQVDVTFIGDDETVEQHKNHDDKHGIPDPVEPLTPQPPFLTNFSSPDPCIGHYDTVAYVRGELFIFKNGWVWRLPKPGHVLQSYPVQIHRLFNKLPQTIKIIDAVYQCESDSSIILFTGNKYWVFNGNDFVEGSPRPITTYGLPNYLNKIDAVMVWDKNKKTYLFSGDKYWRYNETTKTMDKDYPKSIAKFRGVPTNLDAAMTWQDGITYFFKDQLYWAFNNTWKKTEAQYPKSSPQYWLGCN